VGDYNNAPVFTFTAPFNTKQARSGNYTINPDGILVEKTDPSAVKVEGKKDPWEIFPNPLSDAYRTQIASGLKETHGLTKEQADIYFNGSVGAV
jgi:hypothetical protein